MSRPIVVSSRQRELQPRPDRDGHWHCCQSCGNDVTCHDGACLTSAAGFAPSGRVERIGMPRRCSRCAGGAK